MAFESDFFRIDISKTLVVTMSFPRALGKFRMPGDFSAHILAKYRPIFKNQSSCCSLLE